MEDKLTQKEILKQNEDILGDKFVNDLAEILGQEGVSQRAFCRGLGIDSGQISRFFSRKKNMAFEKILMMVDFLGYEIKIVKKEAQ